MEIMCSIPMQNMHFKEINPVFCGYQHCDPGYSFGPAVRHNFLLHCVVEGRGTLYKNGEAYPVEQGEAFLIEPEEITTYTADTENPWYYIWVEFSGEQAMRLKELKSPVFEVDVSLFLNMIRCENMRSMREEYLTGQIFLLLSDIFKGKENKNYVKIAENFLLNNYMYPVKIEQVAASVGLDRRYLSRIFKEKNGIGMQQFLLNKRISEAKKLLKSGLSVSVVSSMVGYEDSFAFSKLFKNMCGLSPKKYALKNAKEN